MNEQQAAKKWPYTVKVYLKEEYEHRRQQAYRKNRNVKRPTKWAALSAR